MKRVFLFLTVFAISAFAKIDNFNFYGQLGFHKTQSAQTLGHGRFGVGVFVEGRGLNEMIEGQKLCAPQVAGGYGTNPNDKDVNGNSCRIPGKSLEVPLDAYIGVNGYPFVSLGLSDYFDFGISMPLYYEQIGIINESNDAGVCLVGGSDCNKDLNSGGQGDLQILAKIRAPFEGVPVDVALILGGSIGTGRTSYQGLWVRDPSLLNVKYTDENGVNRPIAPGASSYTNTSSMLKIGGAATFDFMKTRKQIPLLFHFNYMYRQTLGDDGSNYPVVQTLSAAVEYTPVPYVSILGEYYMDMPNELPEGSSASLSTFTFGSTLHFSRYVDLQMGAQFLLGSDKKYIENLSFPMNDGYATYNAAIVPKWMAFGGLVFKIYTMEPEIIEEEEEEYYEPPSIIFNVDNESIASGQQATLSWIVTNADEVSIEGIGGVDIKGSRRVRPTETTAYTIVATGEGGTRRKTVEITVESAPGPGIVFSASAESVQKGEFVTLTWMVTEATEVSIEGIGKVAVQGTRRVKLSDVGISSFALTAAGPGGTKTQTVEIEVLGGPPPSIIFTASSESIQTGQTVTLSWQITNATEVIIDNDIGKVPAKGTRRIKPEGSTVYTLTATGEGGTEIATVEVEVEAPPVIEARVNLQGVTFGSGNATLTPNAMKVLDGVAEQLLAYPKVKIEIQGHTDSQGSRKSNQDLSERRAKSVVGYLARKGIAMNRMSAVGFGPDMPIADNATKEGREQNRRIEMIRVDE